MTGKFTALIQEFVMSDFILVSVMIVSFVSANLPVLF